MSLLEVFGAGDAGQRLVPSGARQITTRAADIKVGRVDITARKGTRTCRQTKRERARAWYGPRNDRDGVGQLGSRPQRRGGGGTETDKF